MSKVPNSKGVWRKARPPPQNTRLQLALLGVFGLIEFVFICFLFTENGQPGATRPQSSYLSILCGHWHCFEALVRLMLLIVGSLRS